MEEESEKRFQSIMSKLFDSPPDPKSCAHNNTRSGVQLPGGKKRLRSPSALMKLTSSVVEEPESSFLSSSAEAPLCRPWDRGDLFRRLSTYKSITWFAKPKVVSPLECARRGWVNVDMDTIGCTSCGARLLFSTPSTWTHQQVEKAAMVFSLKLESGHKLLCPWIDNACTEELSHFPRVPRATLVDDYKDRLFALSHLVALPVLSSVAMDNMRSPQLEQFFRDFSNSDNNVPIENSGTELEGDATESSSSMSYYQALKLVGLCGWEPHVLPYIVEFKDGQSKSFEATNITVTYGLKQKVSVHSLCTNEGTKTPVELQFHPSSVILDCKLCGASVGLWAFFTVLRPVEYLRFVGFTEVNGKDDSTPNATNALEGSSCSEIHTGSPEGVTGTASTASTSLGFTIAGGLQPAMLNYSATISLPVMGHGLKVQFPLENSSKDTVAVQRPSQDEEDQGTSLGVKNTAVEGSVASWGPLFAAQNPLDGPQNVAGGSDLNVNFLEKETGKLANSAVADHHFGEFSHSTPEDNAASISGGRSDANRGEVVEADTSEQGSYHSNCADTGVGQVTQHKPVLFRTSEDQILPEFHKLTDFDPIKQHRYFCPWIAANGKFAPGWQQVLSALQGHKEFSFTTHNMIEVDDPVASVKKLFTSPSEKRRKRRSLALGLSYAARTWQDSFILDGLHLSQHRQPSSSSRITCCCRTVPVPRRHLFT